jgi:hypothetical protein
LVRYAESIALKRNSLLIAFVALLLPSICHANFIWPAVYIVESYWTFWYIAAFTVIVEAYVFHLAIKCPMKKSFQVSLYTNLFSATIGVFCLLWAMLFFQAIIDDFVKGTFSTPSKVANIAFMFLLTTLVESAFVKVIWKHKIKDTILCFLVGNAISYAVITYELFFLGGWSRTH